MSEKTIKGVLRDLGLTNRESEVYIFVAKSGVIKASDISQALRMHKAQVYHILKNLQSRGMVELTLENPTRFTAIPFEKTLELFIQAKRKETNSFENKKGDILAHWKSIVVEKPTDTLEKFMVIASEGNIYSKILQLIEEAEKEVLVVATSLSIIQASQAEIIKAMEKRNIHFRILTDVLKENLEVVKRITKRFQLKCLGKIKWRHIDLVSSFYHSFVIRDEEEVIFSITLEGDSPPTSRESRGLWTNGKAVVHTLKALFEELWRNAKDIDQRIREIETGKPTEETLIIKGAQAAYERFHEIGDAAKEDVIAVTSAKGVIRIYENYPIRQLWKKGVKIRIMFPVNMDNLETAQNLSKYCQIKHINTSYVRMAIVDNKHLFQFPTPPLDKETAKPLDHMFYTNEPCYIEGAREMLNDLWKRSFDLSEITSEAAMRSPVKVSTSEPVSKVIDDMLRNNIGSVLVVEDNKPVGIITEKDLLDRVIKAHRDTKKTFAQEIMSAPVVTIDADKPLVEALKIMQNKGIRRLAVIKKGNLVGMLTERRALKEIGR